MARTLLAAHTITGNQTYLDSGLNWCDSFVRLKNTIDLSTASALATGENHTTGAWWDSGYGTIYFGDTGTAQQALGLCALKLPLGNERRAHYIEAMRQYAAFVQGGCVQHLMHRAHHHTSSVTDLVGKRRIMRSLGLSEAAIQAAFDVDYSGTTTRDTASSLECPPCADKLSSPMPCPGGILKCPAKGGWIDESTGAIGDGWVDGQLTTKPYTCSTATTGAGSMGALAAVLRGAADCDGRLTNCSKEADIAQTVSFKAASFLMASVSSTGTVTGYNWNGDVENRSSMGGVAYIVDGMVQADIIGFTSKHPAAAEAMRLMALDVAHQITDKGCWGVWGSTDQMRSSRVATILQWHERTFKSDPVVTAALARFVDFITSDRSLFNPATGSCAEQHGGFCLLNNTITTGMVGLAVADLLLFNSTFAWGLPPIAT